MQTLTTKNIYTVGAVSLVMGILFDYFFFDHHVGISFFIYIVLLLGVLFGFLYLFKTSYNKRALWYLPFILFFCAMTGIRDSSFLLFWNFVVSVWLLIIMARHLTGKRVEDYLLPDYARTLIVLPFRMLANAFQVLGKMLTVGKSLKQSGKSSQIIKGIIITLPLFIFFLALLSSADLVFGRLVSNLFSFNINLNPNFVAQTWWVLFFTIVWLGSYTYILQNATTKTEGRIPKNLSAYKFGNIEAGILFGALNFLFLIFVIIQIKYLFAGQGAITNFGFTYAEYAHKGFAELIFVCLLTFGVIFGTEKYIEKVGDKHSQFFKFLSGLMIVLVLVIMASAFLRLSLYEQAYSFTLLRLLVQAFILWLAAIFLWLGYKIMAKVDDYNFTSGIFFSVITFFIVLNLLNPDAFIAQKNIDQFVKIEKLDTLYLSSLSADANPQIISLLGVVGLKNKYGDDLAVRAADILKQRWLEYSNPDNNGSWQSFNFSKQAALNQIEKNLSKISELAK